MDRLLTWLQGLSLFDVLMLGIVTFGLWVLWAAISSILLPPDADWWWSRNRRQRTWKDAIRRASEREAEREREREK